jgi:small subunit ribosomal protein S8
MRHDLLSDVLSAIKNGDNYGKKETISPSSKLVKEVLLILQKNKFIGDFEYIDDARGGKFRIQLLGKVNKCCSIRPRFPVKKDEYEKWEKRFLPAAGFGFLMVSTSKGIMTHIEAKEKELGGKLLAYCY